jgi:hypothetical protein
VLSSEYNITRMVIRCVPESFRALVMLWCPYECDLWLFLPRPYCYFFRHREMRKINRGTEHYTMTFHKWYTLYSSYEIHKTIIRLGTSLL